MAVSLKPLFPVAPPRHRSEGNNMATGVCYRAGRKPPVARKELIDELAEFVDDLLRKEFVPLSPDADLSTEHWLSKTNYPEWRKDELRKARVDNIYEDRRNFHVKGFMKQESYPIPGRIHKHSRGINSRKDPFKVETGPWFKAIESNIFKHDWFIKKIPVSERPQYILDKLYRPGQTYVTSDYTSFEALFTREIMLAVEIRMYKYMTQHLPNHEHFWRILDEVLASENTIHYKFFTVRMHATRMSGEMCTSLGNGFSNLVFIKFLCNRLGSQVEGVVEGDDGLFAIKGPVPTAEDFAELGLIIKIETQFDLARASFCGLIFDPEDLVNVTDPTVPLAEFSWCTPRYSYAKDPKLLSLLRCKSLSLVHSYPGCPIIQSLGLYGLRMTRGTDARTYAHSRHVGEWEREWYTNAIRDEKKLLEKIRSPPSNTRMLVEQSFGISIETQIYVENLLDNKNDFEMIMDQRILDLFPQSWAWFFHEYGTFGSNSKLDIEQDHEKASSWKKLFEGGKPSPKRGRERSPGRDHDSSEKRVG